MEAPNRVSILFVNINQRSMCDRDLILVRKHVRKGERREAATRRDRSLALTTAPRRVCDFIKKVNKLPPFDARYDRVEFFAK